MLVYKCRLNFHPPTGKKQDKEPQVACIACVENMWQVSPQSYFFQFQYFQKKGIEADNNMTIIEKESISHFIPAQVS